MTSPSLDGVTFPASITVLVSKDCPNCAHVVQQVEQLKSQCEHVTVNVVDVFDAPALRGRHEVQSVPATIIDDDIMIQGQVTVRRLTEILVSRGTPAYDTAKMRALLDANRIDAASIFLRQSAPVSVLPILATAELSDRLGVTMVVQTAHEAEPGSLSGLVPGLIDLLSSDVVSLRGDVADLLGMLGDPRAVEPLRALLDDDDSDVVAAAVDAIASIEDRMN